MATLSIPLAQIQIFLLVFLRVSVIMVTLPLFDNRSIPPIFKVGLSLAVTLVLVPVLEIETFPVVSAVVPFVLGAVTEVVLALAIGLSVRLLFTGIQLAGQLAGMQMGFAMANVMDPGTSSQVSIMAQLNYLIAVLIFLSINAHHWFLYAVADSFAIIPPLGFHIRGALTEQIISLAASMFVIAIKVGAPVMAALLLTSAALGIVARTVPQMNIFIVAFPLKIMVGFFFLILALPYLSGFLQDIFGGIGKEIFLILRTGQ